MRSALLLSGGMDSLSIAWWKRPEIGITIDYGQLAAQAEITASQLICNRLGIEHHVVRIDCRSLGSGDMAGADADCHAPASDWWPYRNQILITFAAARSLSLGVGRLMIGTVKSDSTHRDGTSDFVDAMNALVALQEGGIRVEAPAIHLATVELVREAGVPRELLAWAHSCHKANVACANCRGCNKYFEVLNELDGRLG